MTCRQVVNRVDRKVLVPVRRGVYSLGHREPGAEGVWISAVLACGPGAVLSHRSAAALWGLVDRWGPVEVLSPVTGKRRGQIRKDGYLALPLVRQTNNLKATEVTVVDGIPVTTVARTLVDLCAVLNRDQLLRALDSAAIKKVLNLEDLRRAVVDSRGRKGIGTLRSLLLEFHPQTVATRSELEARFLRFLKKLRFDEPRVNEIVADCEVDFHWPEYDMVVELDGRMYHETGRGFEADRDRTTRLELAGKRVLRLTWGMVVKQPEVTARKLFAYRQMALYNKMDAECAAEERVRHRSRVRDLQEPPGEEVSAGSVPVGSGTE